MADRTGQQLGNYRLTRLLGRGGFAEVYLGQHVRLHSQQAAVKVLATRIDPEDEQTFEREADIVASLAHPHIVRLLDYDVVEGVPFLVMEYAPNGSLRQMHRGGQLVPLPTVVSYVQQIASALDFAHYQHLIHRDIKPDNMLLDKCGQILISDFGVATIAHNTTSQSAQAIIGTVAYMAPEQFQEYPRPASDQYALAITVYEWLTGERPFNGTFTEIAVKHAMVPPPPLHVKNPTLPLGVEQVVLTALAKDPKARFPNVRAFASALEVASQTATQGSTLLAAPFLSLPEPLVDEQLSATIPPQERIADLLLGTATVSLIPSLQATLPVLSSAPTLPSGEIITPVSDEITPVEQQSAASTSGPVRLARKKAACPGRNSSIGGLVKRLAYKALWNA